MKGLVGFILVLALTIGFDCTAREFAGCDSDIQSASGFTANNHAACTCTTANGTFLCRSRTGERIMRAWGKLYAYTLLYVHVHQAYQLHLKFLHDTLLYVLATVAT